MKMTGKARKQRMADLTTMLRKVKEEQKAFGMPGVNTDEKFVIRWRPPFEARASRGEYTVFGLVATILLCIAFMFLGVTEVAGLPFYGKVAILLPLVLGVIFDLIVLAQDRLYGIGGYTVLGYSNIDIRDLEEEVQQETERQQEFMQKRIWHREAHEAFEKVSSLISGEGLDFWLEFEEKNNGDSCAKVRLLGKWDTFDVNEWEYARLLKWIDEARKTKASIDEFEAKFEKKTEVSVQN